MKELGLFKNNGMKFSEIRNGPTTKKSRVSIRILSFTMSSFFFFCGMGSTIKNINNTKKEDDCISSVDNIKRLYSSVKNNPNLDDNEILLGNYLSINSEKNKIKVLEREI